MERVLDPLTLVGLLADPDRRAVFSALVLGARTTDEIANATHLPVERAGRALGRLSSAGLVINREGRPHLLAEAFAEAARTTHAQTPVAVDPTADGRTPEQARVFAAFVRDGRINQIPVAHAKRLVLLDWLAQEFEPGKRYSEQMVNLILGQHHPDTAAWRRYLVDEGFLDRAAGQYWRSGGTVAAAES